MCSSPPKKMILLFLVLYSMCQLSSMKNIFYLLDTNNIFIITSVTQTLLQDYSCCHQHFPVIPYKNMKIFHSNKSSAVPGLLYTCHNLKSQAFTIQILTNIYTSYWYCTCNKLNPTSQFEPARLGMNLTNNSKH